MSRMVLTRLTRWLLFTVAVALVPFAFAWLRAYQHGERGDLVDLLGGGDLYLVAGALCAGAIGDLMGCAAPRSPRHAAACAVAVILLAGSSLLFADVTAARTQASGMGTPGTVDAKAVAEVSAWVFTASVLVGATCVGLGERCSTTKP